MDSRCRHSSQAVVATNAPENPASFQSDTEMCAVMTSSRERLPHTLSESRPAAAPDDGDSAHNGQSGQETRDPRYDQAFAALSFVMNRHFIDHLLRSMRELDMDAESLILLGLVSHLGLARLMTPGAAGGDAAPSRREPQPVRLRDLTVVSRLPRETIRRKLVRLRDAGYLEQRARGWVLLPGRIDERIRAFNYQTLRRLLTTARELEAILVQAGRRPAAFMDGPAGGAAGPGKALSSGPPCPVRTGRRTSRAPHGRPPPGDSSR